MCKSFKIIVFTLVCSTANYSLAQNISFLSQKIAPKLLRQDFSLLRDTMQKIHPGLYVYKSKESIDNMFDSCFATIKDSMTITRFYVLIKFVIASIGDGHTNCRLSNQFIKDYYGSAKVFPAMVVSIHNRAFIFCCKQNKDLTGTELLSINNNSLSDIIQRMFKYVQSDGFIQSHKNWELPEEFQLLLNALYGESNSYNVTYKTKSGDIKSASLQ
jgi:hypothetical protein